MAVVAASCKICSRGELPKSSGTDCRLPVGGGDILGTSMSARLETGNAQLLARSLGHESFLLVVDPQ